MENFEYYTPTKIIFGKGAEERVGTEIASRGYKKVLVHFGGTYLQENGTLDRIHKSLTEAGLTYIDLDGVVPNPRLALAKEGVELCKREGIDFILGVGGGSAIDSSKAIAYGLANDFDLEDLFMGRIKTDKIFPVGCITTIAATGSEMSNSAVVTIQTKDQGVLKRSYNHDCARPLFAAMNPELTYTLPAYQTASGGADIMMHTLDRYFTQTENNELTDEIAEGLLRTVIRNGAVAIKDSQDYNAMSEIMWAGSLSHNGITGLGAEKDFAVHQLGHELSAKFDIAHGASLSAVWGAWATYVYDAKPARFAQYARRVWNVEEADDVKAAQEGIRKTVTYFASLNMPTSFREAKEIGSKTDEEVKQMAHGCSYEGTRTIGSFKVCDENDIYEIYKLANK